MKEYRGFEVTCQGESFMVAFGNPKDAIAWCIQVQLQLLQNKWHPKLHSLHEAAQELKKDAVSVCTRDHALRRVLILGIHAIDTGCDELHNTVPHFVDAAMILCSLLHWSTVVASLIRCFLCCQANHYTSPL